MSTPILARKMWRVFDTLHAVTYFAPECDQEFRACGLKGFWMGYFAGRSAPMGAVEPAVATATFYNFAPKMASRACSKRGRECHRRRPTSGGGERSAAVAE